MDFGMKLQSLRKEKGLSQEALAESLNVSRQAVSKWESGAGYPEMDKLILISDLFQVSLDYLMKENREPIVEDYHQKLFFNNQKITEYIQYKKQFALKIGLSVASMILSVIFLLVLDKTKYEGFGVLGMFTIVGLAVAVLIITGISSESYSELEKREINMSFQDLGNLQSQYTKFKTTFGISIAVGVCMIIISVALGGFMEMYFHNEMIAGVILMVSVAIAVFIFIYQGVCDSMYKFLVENKKYIQEQKIDENSLFAITMPLAAMAYLVMGFTKDWWHPGWIIFPVVAVITMAIEKTINRED